MRLVRFEHPRQTPLFVELVTALKERLEGKLTASLEPTGTYGDAVRLALYERGVSIMMVSPKRTHDSAAVFERVESLHDPKCADILVTSRADRRGYLLGHQLLSPAVETLAFRVATTSSRVGLRKGILAALSS